MECSTKRRSTELHRMPNGNADRKYFPEMVAELRSNETRWLAPRSWGQWGVSTDGERRDISPTTTD